MGSPSRSVPDSRPTQATARPSPGHSPQDTAACPRSSSWPDDNSAAYAQNADLPNTTPQHANTSPAPTSQPRKPSEVGLSLQTHVASPTDPPADPFETPTGPVVSAPTQHPKRRPAPLEAAGEAFTSNHSRTGSAASPASSASSPALAALSDVTPLPSPINPTFSTDLWKKVSGRPHSSSSASVERERATGGFLTPTLSASSPGKTKIYPYLGPSATPPPASAPHEHQHSHHNHHKHHENSRSISEFVPDPLQNVRPRTVTGPSVVTPPPKPSSSQVTDSTPLQREAYLAKERGSVDLTAGDATRSLPSPPPSNIGASDEEEDTRKQRPPLPPLLVKDQLSGKTATWQPLRILGTGSFSEVFLATPGDVSSAELSDLLSSENLPPQTARPLVAIKFVSHHSGNDNERMDTSIKREIEILQSMKHPCLPRLYGFEDNETRALLVMNYCAGGDLFELASQHRHLLQPTLIQRIFAELVAAVAYLHSQYIVHRDIKLENVLLNLSIPSLRNLPCDPSTWPHPLITLTDLGLSKHIPPPPASALLTHPCGSVDYAAPEILLGQPYDGRATDAWALGVLLYALIEGRLPFDPLPEYAPTVNSPHRRRRRARGSGSSVKHRIARCDWLWCEFGDEDGDWVGADVVPRCRELEGARACVEGLLKKAGRGRWPLDRVAAEAWVCDGIRVPGGLRVEDGGAAAAAGGRL